MLKNQGNANQVTYFGAIAKDEAGGKLENVVKNEGITGNFHYTDKAETGRCAVIVTE